MTHRVCLMITVKEKLKLLIFQNNYVLLFLHKILRAATFFEASAAQIFAEFCTKWKRFSSRKVFVAIIDTWLEYNL